MDLQTVNRMIGLTETIFDDFDERPVDCDFVLPDFLPDIAAILKCSLHPVVQTYQISGDRLSADGTVRIHLLYLDEERRCVRCFEHTQPFTSEFTVKGMSANSAVSLEAKPNYVNCRATGPRRVDIHGAFSIKLTVIAQSDTAVVEEAACDGLHSKTAHIAYMTRGTCADKTFTLNEVLEPEHEGMIDSIVRSDAQVCLAECKQLPGKAILKGDLLLTAVYVTDSATGELCRFKTRIPFSQILDVEGLSEDALCDYRAEILSFELQPIQNPNGENRLLSVSIKTALHIQCYQTEACDVLCDVFHTQYPVKAPTCRLDTSYITGISQETVPLRQTVALPDSSVKQVLDVWCMPLHIQEEENRAVCRSTVCLLARDDNGAVQYYERPLECDFTRQIGAGETLSAVPADLDYSVSGDQLELRLQAVVKCCTATKQTVRAITDLQLDDSAPYTCSQGMEHCQVKICFADAGTSVWEIAKREHASPTGIAQENDLTEDVLREPTPLLIPLR